MDVAAVRLPSLNAQEFRRFEEAVKPFAEIDDADPS